MVQYFASDDVRDPEVTDQYNRLNARLLDVHCAADQRMQKQERERIEEDRRAFVERSYTVCSD